MLYTHIREVPASILCREASYTVWDSSVVFSVQAENFRECTYIMPRPLPSQSFPSINKPNIGGHLIFLPFFLSALQLGVCFGLLNNLTPFFFPSEADYLVSEQFSFYGVRLLASRPTWRTWMSLFVWLLTQTCPAWVTLPVPMLPPA
jgi:hypothetical protein